MKAVHSLRLAVSMKLKKKREDLFGFLLSDLLGFLLVIVGAMVKVKGKLYG